MRYDSSLDKYMDESEDDNYRRNTDGMKIDYDAELAKYDSADRR